MNIPIIIKFLDLRNIEYYLNEIFYDENENEIDVDYYENDIDYYLNNYDYDYEIIIDITDVDDVDELIHKIIIFNKNDDIEIINDNNVELILKNKE